jgi:NAD+ diphosphatase
MSGPAGGFRLCPSCGDPRIEFRDGKRWLCPACGFEYYHSVATAAGILIDCSGQILFVERAMEPRKGCLALPGGFVNPAERAEDAAIRECQEEIGWYPKQMKFLSSFPNAYQYNGITYNTCDFYFYAQYYVDPGDDVVPVPDETASVHYIRLSSIPMDRVAFPSLRRAIEAYRILVGSP